jgi:hypothetical protein
MIFNKITPHFWSLIESGMVIAKSHIFSMFIRFILGDEIGASFFVVLSLFRKNNVGL